MLLNLYGNQISKLPPRGFQDLLNLRFLMLGQVSSHSQESFWRSLTNENLF